MIKKYIVKFNNDIDNLSLANLANKHNFTLFKRYINCLNGALIEMNENQYDSLKNDKNIEYIEEDKNVKISEKKNASIDGLSFPLSSVVKPLWYQSLTNTQINSNNHSSINCYIVDTGINSKHIEFTTNQVILDYSTVKGIKSANDDNGHGTKVASIIGGKNIGIANNITLHAVKVLDSTGNGSISNVISGLDWIIKNKKSNSIINMSLEASYSAILNSAVVNCINAGIFVVCAAGNDNTDIISISPASASNVYPIGAINSSLSKSSFSNYGGVLTFMPGEAITCAFNDASNALYCLSDGTSFSSPITTALIAKILLSSPSITKTQLDIKLNTMEIINSLSNIPLNTPNQYLKYM